MKQFAIGFLIIFIGLNGCSVSDNRSKLPSEEADTHIQFFQKDYIEGISYTSDHEQTTQPEKQKISLPAPSEDFESHSSIALDQGYARSYWFSFKAQAKELSQKQRTTTANFDNRAPGLWGELPNHFQFYEEHKNRPIVQKFIARITANPRVFNRTTAGASPYLHYVYAEIKKRNMPMELALLPIVESRYYPFAVSKQRAAGLWQFTPNTGRHYGLRQNWWYDGRFDVIASTNSALNLLQDLHAKYNNWPLALAAYNYGLGNVDRAIRKAKKLNKGTDYWSLKLPKETTEYVPKLIAYSQVIGNFKQYDLQIQPIGNNPILAVVDIDRPFELEMMAAAAQVSLKTFRQLNPAFKRWVTKPKGQYKVLVPIKNRDYFVKSLSAQADTHLIEWKSHNVQTGDTLYDLARLYGITVQALKNANSLTKHIIRPGDKLIIPIGPA